MRSLSRVVLAVCAVSCRSPAVNPAPTGSPPTAAASTVPDTNAAANRAFVAAVLKGIVGRETQPAESVYMNVTIPWLGKTQARTFLWIMNVGYARALGVRCTYCHVETDFASDAKLPKRAAREMAMMHRMINIELECRRARGPYAAPCSNSMDYHMLEARYTAGYTIWLRFRDRTAGEVDPGPARSARSVEAVCS